MPPHFVLLPGLDGTGDLFRCFLNELPSGYSRSVVRYPTSLSSYLDLAAVVRSAIPEYPGYVLVAESFSAPLAIQIASTHPGDLRGLIFCGGFASSPVRGARRAAIGFASPWLFQRGPSESTIRRFLAGPTAPKELVDEVRNAVGQVPPRVLADRLRQVLACNVRSEVPKIWVPILCLRGSADHLVGEHCTQEILSQAQREESMSVVIDGPHMILQTQPEACVDAIADFIHHKC